MPFLVSHNPVEPEPKRGRQKADAFTKVPSAAKHLLYSHPPAAHNFICNRLQFWIWLAQIDRYNCSLDSQVQRKDNLVTRYIIGAGVFCLYYWDCIFYAVPDRLRSRGLIFRPLTPKERDFLCARRGRSAGRWRSHLRLITDYWLLAIAIRRSFGRLGFTFSCDWGFLISAGPVNQWSDVYWKSNGLLLSLIVRLLTVCV